jgi:signal transduction histidine kinase/ActR/RegA family two-component response regulator|nr:ATP-binding protein [Rhodoferax sp.]
MTVPARRKKFHITPRPVTTLQVGAPAGQGELMEGYAPSQMIEDLRKYQSELEIQNKALRYSQQEAEGASERFATLFSNVPLALMVVDEEGMVMASNAMALRLFQPLESDPPLNFLLPFVGPEHTDEVAVSFLSAKAEGTSEISEVVFLAGSQGSFTGDLHIARIENPMGELAHFICAVIDQGPLLTQRHALQKSAAILQQRNEDLLLSENRMTAIINSSLDAILCIDEQRRITVFNPAATALFECPADLALRSTLGRFLPEVEALLSTGQIPTQTTLGEFVATTLKGREIFVEISVSLERRLNTRTPGNPLANAIARRGQQGMHGEITTIFARDLTAGKLAEARRVALETQLRESQKMQAMGTMAGGIAHDFNNILSAILGNVELAKQDTAANSAALTSLQEIDKAGRRARDLVRQILTFSRNEVPKRIPIQLDDVVREAARLVKVALPPSVNLKVKIAPHTAAILADTTQVEQALLNLCTNALLAIGNKKGALSIELASTEPDAPHLGRLGLSAGPYVTISVRDNGSGMSEQTLARIFEPFFTTREVGQGTGLGLSVVHGIMQGHQGAIDVYSVPGEGSVFTLYFPPTLEEAVAPVAEAAPVEPISGQGRHVMYVDDDQALVFLIVRVLKRRGFTVTSFTDPHEALAAFQAHPDTFDLVVTDYNMPGYSGIDLLRQLKLIRADMPVALASGYVTPELEQSAIRDGANALIYKPDDVSEFCETVQRLISGSDAA